VRPRLRALLLVGVLLALSHSAAASAAPIPSDFFGVSSPELISRTPAQRAPVLADQRTAGVRVIRQLFDWSAIEPTKGTFSWTSTDSFLTSAARAGTEVLPVVLYSPTWASSCPSATTPRQCRPADNADYGAFLVTLIGRYGPDGSFWRSNPSVPKLPITAWQIWNEPNFPSFWGGAPNAAEYADMLKAVAPIIRAADPHAEIVSAGMPDSLVRTAIRLVPYVTDLYANGVKGTFDDMGLHLYNNTPDLAVGLVDQTRAIMNANGDNAVPIWVTEWGWASSGAPSRFTVDLPGQAANVDALMGAIVARHTELNVRGLAEYLWRDGTPQSNVTDVWSNHLGMVFDDYTHKPSYDAFRNRAIDTTPPDTILSSAPAGTVLPGPQSIAFSADQAGSDLDCSLDGAAFSACSSPYSVPTLPLGVHTFQVRATDPYGNVDPTPAAAQWVAAVPPPVYDPRAVQASAHSMARTLGTLDLRKLAKKKSVTLRLSWPGPGLMTVVMKASRKTIGRGAGSLGGSGQGALQVRFTSTGRKLLKRSKRLRVTLSQTFDPSALGSATLNSSASFTLKQRRR
jgi:polysaccharide biosynthesis protein PslG